MNILFQIFKHFEAFIENSESLVLAGFHIFKVIRHFVFFIHKVEPLQLQT